MNLHRLIRELTGHSKEIARDLYRILKVHAWIIVTTAQAAVLNAELPHHCPQPLLTGPQVCYLAFCAVEVGR